MPAVFERRTAERPQRVLQPLDKRHVALAAQNDVGTLEARVDPPETVKPVTEPLAGDGDAESATLVKFDSASVAVANIDTEIATLTCRSPDTFGRSGDTALTAFTNGCLGLRRILADAGVTEAPMLHWFYIAMRLQHSE